MPLHATAWVPLNPHNTDPATIADIVRTVEPMGDLSQFGIEDLTGEEEAEFFTNAYVDLRTSCVRAGHGLGGKEHEADRWVGAVALAGNLPLATDDSIFDDVRGLNRLHP